MINGINLVIFGILSSILMFGIKSGIGCGFADLKKYEIVVICAGYFIISTGIGYFIGSGYGEFLEKISSIGLSFHIVLAVLMIAGGIHTQKQWNCGCDVSRRTFLFLSFPCPVCLGALFITCTMLATTLGLSGIVTGVIVGSIFFLSALAASFYFRRLGKTPETLGSMMMFVGIFYVLAALLVPAYMLAKTMTIPSLPVNTGATLTSLAILSMFITAGFVLHNGGE
jgi:predicted transporter